jgi:hypothetical protein
MILSHILYNVCRPLMDLKIVKIIVHLVPNITTLQLNMNMNFKLLYDTIPPVDLYISSLHLQ